MLCGFCFCKIYGRFHIYDFDILNIREDCRWAILYRKRIGKSVEEGGMECKEMV